MLLAHHREHVHALREPTANDPWRVLVSGCIVGMRCGVDGTDYGMGAVLAHLTALPTLRAIPFCPEDHALGTPRTTPDIDGGDGFDVIAGRARVVDEHGADLTDAMLAGGRAMVAHALAANAELAILTDMSGACGSQVISDGSRFVDGRRYRMGVGVATALLLEAGIPVVSPRDYRTMGMLRARLEPGWMPPADARDHHEHPWVLENLCGGHPRASFSAPAGTATPSESNG